MGLTVTVLGCSGSYPAAGSACTGYLVRGGGVNVLLDCGPGTLANLQRHLPLEQLDAIVVTHCHADHWVELPIINTVYQWFLHRGELPVHTTEETWAMNAAVCGGQPEALQWQRTSADTVLEIGGLRWTFSRTDHPVETLAVRVDDDTSSFAFSADTGPDWSFDRLGPGIDLAFCEASFLSVREPEQMPHLSARQAGAMAAAAGVDRLVLTHPMPGADLDAHVAEGTVAFGRPVEVATIHRTHDV